MWRRPVVAGVLLLVMYVGLSFLNSPRGFLGTDTGGKVATLEAMTRGSGMSPDPGIGYWAEQWDPDGSVHPLYYTARIGDRWVNVTTLPMLYAALPLYELAGYRAALLFPMLGSVAAAFAARALARRAGADDRGTWVSFWIVGVASPMTIYALDFWEHSWGVALMGWAVVLLWDVVASAGRRWPAAGAAGLLLGLAFTMRTEALVYLAAAGAVTAIMLLRPRGRSWRSVRSVPSLRSIALGGAAALVAFVVVAGVMDVVERQVLGAPLRAARASGISEGVGDVPRERLTEAAFTLVGAEGSARGVLVGAAVVAAAVYAVLRWRSDARIAAVALGGAGALLAVRFGWGLGFVPGMLVAWPGAVLALSLLRGSTPRNPGVDPRRSETGAGVAASAGPFVVAVATVALPVVLATQFRGGAAPQWAGRYILASGLLLTSVGVGAVLPRVPCWMRRAFIAAMAVITAFGLAWLSVRSHDVERAIAAIDARPEPVVVSSIAHLAREGGATYGRQRWLTAVSAADRREAVEVVEQVGERSLVFVRVADDDGQRDALEEVRGWSLVSSDRVELFRGIDLALERWERRAGR